MGGPSEYPNYGWATSGPGTYEATPAACQPQSKSEGEGTLLPQVVLGTWNAYTQTIDYLQRTTHIMGLQASFTDDCPTLPDDVQAYTSPPDLFAQQATHPPHTIADGRSSSDTSGPLPSASSMIAPCALRAVPHTPKLQSDLGHYFPRFTPLPWKSFLDARYLAHFRLEALSPDISKYNRPTVYTLCTFHPCIQYPSRVPLIKTFGCHLGR